MVFETQLDGFSLLVQNERGFLQFLFRTVGMTSNCACSACLFFFALLLAPCGSGEREHLLPQRENSAPGVCPYARRHTPARSHELVAAAHTN